MSARGPFRGSPSFPPPLRFGQPAVFGQGGGPAGLPFAPAATYALGQAPVPAGNAGFSFRPPTSLGGFPTSSEASGGGGGAFAAPEFRFKAPESAAAFKPVSGGEAEKGPAAPAAFAFSSPFGFASETGPEAAVVREPFSFSRPAAALGRPEERGPRVLPEDPGEPPSKGLKRKEERERSPRRAAASGRAAAPPEKRAVMLSRPRGGILFGRTLEDLLRSQAREQRERGDGPEAERGPAEDPPPAEAREPAREDAAPAVPARRSHGSESTEALGGLPASELTALQCKNIPDYLNDRTVLEKHFGQFVKVRRIMTRRNKKMAVLHFFDHVSIRSGITLGSVQPGKVSTDTLEPLPVPKVGLQYRGKATFCRDRLGEGKECKLKEELDVREKLFEDYEALEQAAQRSCGCPIPGSVRGQVDWGAWSSLV